MSKPKMTNWFPPKIKPVYVGEYNASVCRNEDVRRWWNGSHWSENYRAGNTEAKKQRARAQRCWHVCGIEWRGLAENPNKETAK